MRTELGLPGDLRRAPEPTSERDAFLSALRGLAGTVARRRRWIAGCVGLCVAAALALILVWAPAYVSTAQVLLDPRGLNVTENEVVPRPPSSDVNDAIIETQVRLLTSDGVLARAAERLDLAHDPDYARPPGLLQRLKASLLGPAPEATAAERADGTVARLRREVGVQREGKSFVVAITARAGTPEKAARLATTIATVFIDELERRRRDIVVQARDAMAATLAGQRDRLAKSEAAVERYRRSIDVVDADGRLLNTTRLAELNSQLLAARTSTRTLSARLQQLEALRRPGGAAPATAEAVDSLLLTQLRTSSAEVARQQENLRATLGPRHPQAVEMEAQVRSLNRAVAGEIARLIATAQGDLKAATAREQALTRDLAKAEGAMARTNAALVDLRQLDREALAQRSVYEKFLGRERELREQESVGGTNATLVADAKPAPENVGLRPALLIAAAVAAGLLLGTGGAVAVERFDGRVHTPEGLTARTGIGVIGVLPMAAPVRADERSGVASLLTPGRGTQTSRALYRVADALDAVARERPTKLLVLSASEGLVRPLLSTNIVLAQARSGRRTLLVDADERSGRLRWLAGPSGADAAVVSCAVEGFPPFSATLARRARASLSPREDVLAGLDDYECIVVDASCAMEEIALRRLADAATAIVLVVQGGLTTFAQVEDLQATLTRNAGKLLGALVVVPGTDAAVPTATTVVATPRGRVGAIPSFRGEFS